MKKSLKCTVCRRRFRVGSHDFRLWNGEWKAGLLVAVLCPKCQTPEQDIEAQVNNVFTRYVGTVNGRAIGVTMTPTP